MLALEILKTLPGMKHLKSVITAGSDAWEDGAARVGTAVSAEASDPSMVMPRDPNGQVLEWQPSRAMDH